MTATDTTTATSQATEAVPSKADVLCERLFGAAMGTTDIISVYLGDRLGLYRCLHEVEAVTSADLAARAGVDERYVREWLEHQAATGILEVVAASPSATERRYAMPPEYTGVFLDPDDLAHIAPLVRAMIGLILPIETILDAFRSGRGIPYVAYGPEFPAIQEGFNRPAYHHLLASDWLPSVPDVHARLQEEPAARVADVACGAAWSSIAIARGYPRVRVDGFDLDGASIAIGRQNVRDAGLEERIQLHEIDIADVPGGEPYDLVTVFEAIHDMARPVEALARIHGILREDGAVIVMDSNVGDEFTAPAEHFLDPFFYATSMCLCLPAGRADEPSAATGAVMRPATLERYAVEAGFRAVEPLPIAFPFFRFYRLRP